MKRFLSSFVSLLGLSALVFCGTTQAAVNCTTVFDRNYFVMEIRSFEGIQELFDAAQVLVLDRRGPDEFVVSLPNTVDAGALMERTLSVTSSPPTILADENLGIEEKVVPAISRADPDETFEVLVQFYRGVRREAIECVLQELDPAAELHAPRTWKARISLERINALSAVERAVIRRIERGPGVLRPLNEHARAATRADGPMNICLPPTCPGRTFDLSGQGVKLAIADFGIYEEHKDLTGRIYIKRSPDIDLFHGTHVASIAAGGGIADEKRYGHAPEAGIGDYRAMGTNFSRYAEALATDGSHLINHSYEIHPPDGFDTYRSEYGLLDDYVRGGFFEDFDVLLPAVPHVWAAGFCQPGYPGCRTKGRSAPTNISKNTILVGAAEAASCVADQVRCVVPGASSGPTLDGRIKPDLIAPGCHDNPDDYNGIWAAMALTADYYYPDCSTSMAAPVVSGIVALVMQRMNDAELHAALPSTIRALLVHTAVDQLGPENGNEPGYHEGPDGMTGWGLVNAEAAASMAGEPGLWLEAALSSEEPALERCVMLTEAQQLRATLAWDDRAGVSCDDENCDPATPVLRNDLDVVLIQPDTGAKVLPWTLKPDALSGYGYSAVRDQDHINNVERAESPAPVKDLWRIRVSATKLMEPQPFSLVLSHAPVDCPKRKDGSRKPDSLKIEDA